MIEELWMTWSLEMIFNLSRLDSVKYEKFEIERLKIGAVLIGPVINEILEQQTLPEIALDKQSQAGQHARETEMHCP